MRPIENRVVVLATHEDKVFYCNALYVPIADMEGKLTQSFTMCRVRYFDKASGTLTLKKEGSGPLNKEHYLINSEANVDIFKAIEVKRIKMYGHSMPMPQVPVKNVGTFSEYEKKIYERTYVEPFMMKDPYKEVEKFADFNRVLPITDLTFGKGIITFQLYVREVSTHITFEVTNSIVQLEFNSIRKYFAAQFKDGSANIRCLVRYKGVEVLEARVLSHNLDAINKDTISVIVDNLIQDYIIDFETQEVRALEEALKDVYEIPDENAEQWLMSKLSNESLTKHHEHLMYLSGLHDRQLFPLKVTGKPISFMFGFRNKQNIFIVWETHNTKEATYIWRLDSEADSELSSSVLEAENNVKLLRQGNKRSYRVANKDNDDFRVIEHDYNLPDNGFEKWRGALEEYTKN